MARTRLVPERLLMARVVLALMAADTQLPPTAAAPMSATTLTLTPAADAYVDAARPSTNLGSVAMSRSPARRKLARKTDTAGLSGEPCRVIGLPVPQRALSGAAGRFRRPSLRR